MTASALYAGTVRHRRFAVREREFRHRIVLAYLDLDELPSLLGGRLLARRPGLVRFRRRDYLGDPAVPLGDAVRALAGTHGPVRVLASLRSLGRCFNPVSFYYCFDAAGARVDAIVAEVTNTPWGERHPYVLARRGDGPVLRGSFGKELHVSPFLGMGLCYDWRATEPGATLSVHIAGGGAFDATLALRRRPLSTRTLVAAPWRMLALIYGHGVALKLRGVPVHRHPAAA